MLVNILSLCYCDLNTLKNVYVAGLKKEIKTLVKKEEWKEHFYRCQFELLFQRRITSEYKVSWVIAYKLTKQGLLHHKGNDYIQLALDFGIAKPSLELAGVLGWTEEEIVSKIDIKSVANINDELIDACSNGYVTVVKILLKDDRVNPTTNDSCCLQIACANGHSKVVNLLLKDGRVDPRANYSFSLRGACKNGHAKVVELLLGYKRAILVPNDHCLQEACGGWSYRSS